jgi:hypothetical protein
MMIVQGDRKVVLVRRRLYDSCLIINAPRECSFVASVLARILEAKPRDAAGDGGYCTAPRHQAAYCARSFRSLLNTLRGVIPSSRAARD